MSAPDVNRDFSCVAGDGFNVITALAAQTARKEDLEDYNYALSGIEVRNRHTRSGGAKSQEAERKRRERVTEQLTALAQKLRDDPDYAALYYATEDLLTRAETLTERALSKAHKDLTNAEEAMRKVMNNAARLPDGRHVFRDEDGSFWGAQDRRISDEDAAGIIWHEGNSTRGDLKAASNIIKDSRDAVDRLTHYQVDVLGDARDKYSDKSVVMSEEELNTMQDDILQRGTPLIRQTLSPDNEVGPVQTGDVTQTAKPAMF